MRMLGKFLFGRGAYSSAKIWSAKLTTSAVVSKPQLPPCDHQPQPYDGLPTEEVLSLRKEFISPGLPTPFKKPVIVSEGYKQYVYDNSGKRYLDMFGGMVTISVGYGHPRIQEAAQKQMSRIWHTGALCLSSVTHEYAQKLVSKLPGNLSVVYFTNSGGEAVDLAMWMARIYTGAFNILSLRKGYHGTSPYSRGLLAFGPPNYPLPFGFGSVHSVNPDVYKGEWGGARCRPGIAQTQRSCDCPQGTCKAADRYADDVRDALESSCPKRVAAMFIEPIQGFGGGVPMPTHYVKKAFELTKEHGGLCVVDDIQTGFGRTGDNYWGFESYDVMPDIVTLAKGIGGGFPLAAVVTTPEVAETMGRGLHLNTYGGNPLSCAVGSTVLDIIDEEGLQENARVQGELLLKGLMTLRDEFEVVGDVRGQGLMIGIELVKNKETKEPLPLEEFLDIWEECKDNGLILGKGGYHNNCFRIAPPMCVNNQDMEFTVEVIRNALKKRYQ